MYNEETDSQKLTFYRIALCMIYTVDIKTLEINSFGVFHFCAEIQQVLRMCVNMHSKEHLYW